MQLCRDITYPSFISYETIIYRTDDTHNIPFKLVQIQSQCDTWKIHLHYKQITLSIYKLNKELLRQPTALRISLMSVISYALVLVAQFHCILWCPMYFSTNAGCITWSDWVVRWWWLRWTWGKSQTKYKHIIVPRVNQMILCPLRMTIDYQT